VFGRNVSRTYSTTYYIQVSGYCCNEFLSSEGTFTLNLQRVIPPPNDNFDSAETISGEPASVNGTTAGATREAGEPDHYTSNLADADLWEGDQ
jgi:hypothetical protein